MALTAEQMLQRAHVTLMRSKEFCLLSAVLMCGKSEVVENIPTARTDGWNTEYDRKFFSKLNDKERNAVVAHENFHKMLRQLTVWKKLWQEDARRANMAADYVINLMIEDLDPRHTVCHLPDDALLDRKYKGMSTKEVFDLLKNDKGGGSGGNGKSFDEHDPTGDEELSDREAQAREQLIDQAIRQGAILAGKMGSGGNRLLTELTTPKVDWREQLREFVQATCDGRDTSTWRRPNRRYLAQDLYMPSLRSESMGTLVVGIDTSGSIGQGMINLFASELTGICDMVSPEKVIVLWWDTRVCSTQVFTREQYGDLATLLKPAGGGGTDPTCVFDVVETESYKPDACVMLTDGCIGNWGQPQSYPVLWAITTSYTAPWGVSISLKD